jgi:spermidine synthase
MVSIAIQMMMINNSNNKRIIILPFFVDIFDATNNVPLAFCQHDFVSNLHDSLQKDGVLIANFHIGSAAENQRLKLGQQTYAQVFGGQSNVLSITCRYQGNVILVAVKDSNKNKTSKPRQLDIGQAQRLGQKRQWPFDPASRLQTKYLG